jgi:hypothetical protein
MVWICVFCSRNISLLCQRYRNTFAKLYFWLQTTHFVELSYSLIHNTSSWNDWHSWVWYIKHYTMRTAFKYKSLISFCSCIRTFVYSHKTACPNNIEGHCLNMNGELGVISWQLAISSSKIHTWVSWGSRNRKCSITLLICQQEGIVKI